MHKVLGRYLECQKLSSLHERVSSEMNRILMGEDDLPEWITHGCTVLLEGPAKR